MRIGQSRARRSYTNNGVSPAELIKYPLHSTKVPPPFFYRGAKCPDFWPKFRPQSSSNRRILELWRFIGKQNKRQGPMIGLPSHQSWVGWVPQLPEPLAQWVPHRVKVENFLYILHSSGPAQYSAPMLYHLLGPWLL